MDCDNEEVQATKKMKKECEYCKGRSLKEIDGKSFNLKPTAGFENDRKYNSWIMKSKKRKKSRNYDFDKW